MSDESPVLCVDEGRVRVLTLNRPHVLNALDSRSYALMRDALAAAGEDDSIRCVLITGAGTAFSAGSDLNDPGLPDGHPDPYPAFIELVESFPKPLVVAVNGPAIGIGMTMLGHADLVLAADKARFRLPFAGLGLVPEAGSTATLPRLLGPQNTARMLFTGCWLTAREAEQAGLVYRVVDDTDVLPEALAACADMCESPLSALIATKRLLIASKLESVRSARLREETEFSRLRAEPAHQEALAAFRDKRKPHS